MGAVVKLDWKAGEPISDALGRACLKAKEELGHAPSVLWVPPEVEQAYRASAYCTVEDIKAGLLPPPGKMGWLTYRGTFIVPVLNQEPKSA